MWVMAVPALQASVSIKLMHLRHQPKHLTSSEGSINVDCLALDASEVGPSPCSSVQTLGLWCFIDQEALVRGGEPSHAPSASLQGWPHPGARLARGVPLRQGSGLLGRVSPPPTLPR